MQGFKHFLVTRFNVREEPQAVHQITSANWLEYRVSLFERFCLPSVIGQSCQDFHWLIFFDEATPEYFRQKIDSYNLERSTFEAVFVDRFSQDVVSREVLKRLPEDATHIITSRLDNDDAIGKEFVLRVQQAFEYQDAEVINLTFGVVCNGGRLYIHKDVSNAFASLIEKATDIRTVTARWHTRLCEIAPIRQLDGDPCWLQVIHGNNRKNRVRGRRVAPGAYSQLFVLDPRVSAQIAEANGYLLDKILLDHVRAVREFAISIVKIASNSFSQIAQLTKDFTRRAYWRVLRAAGRSAHSWDLQFQAGRWGADHRSSVVTERVEALCAGGKLVEFGCGFGDLPRSLRPGTFSTYIGIDISPYAIEEAKRRVEACGILGCEFIAQDMSEWPGDKEANLIVLEECLMYLRGKQLEAFLKTCCDSLAPGGYIFVTIFSATKHADTISMCRQVCNVAQEELVGTRTFLLLNKRVQ